MEGVKRSRFQGVANVLRFNWTYYAFGVTAALMLVVVAMDSEGIVHAIALTAALLVVISSIVSIAATYYVYDRSGLYELSWLDRLLPSTPSTILNIHAGFDEISGPLQRKFPRASLRVFDCYDPKTSTEHSIERARSMQIAAPEAERIAVTSLPLESGSVDAIFLIFAAHEIRDATMRTKFFRELKRTLSPNGTIVLLEHVRDVPNAIVYSFGIRHFYSVRTWIATIAQAGLRVAHKTRITPFVRVFVINRGSTS